LDEDMKNLTLRADETLLARLDALRAQVERQHRFKASTQQLLMMLVLCGLDHLEQPAADDGE
jgi:hypothetical protein